MDSKEGISALRLGVDVGGTFTDIVLTDETSGTVFFHKVPSVPSDPAQAILAGITELMERIGRQVSDLRFFGHGTTVATNMVIERKGSRTGLITTRGFRDILEIGRQMRRHLYDYRTQRPAPLVPREWRLEVGERLDAHGEVLLDLDRAGVEAAARTLKEAGVEAVALCFLHAWRNESHEREALDIVRRVMPDVYVSTSAEVSPEFREFDRFSTTVLNTYVGVRVSRYLRRLCDRLQQAGVPILPYIIHSNGGLMSVETASSLPARTCLSGPAAGVKGAAVLAGEADFSDVITFDVGGTSTDISLVLHGETVVASGREVAGYPVRVPSADIHVVGAGGGSIAWIDEGGALKVGPHSAGADPGPVAYGRGGIEPTLTDANIVLGRLDRHALLGGRMPVDAEAARAAIRERIAEPLGLTVEEAALGITRVAAANMGRAIRSVTTERGYAPERFALFAYGGAGPLHAADVAAECGIPTIVVPQEPGTLCARGILLADVSLDFVRTRIQILQPESWPAIAALLAELREEADKWLAGEGVAPADRHFPVVLDMRYSGQNHEVNVRLPGIDIQLDEVLKRFEQAHQQACGYTIDGRAVEMVGCRITGVGRVERRRPQPPVQQGELADAQVGSRSFYLSGKQSWVDAPVYKRALLPVGVTVRGTAIIEEMSSTIIVPHDAQARVDRHGNVIMQLQGAGYE